MALVSDPSLAAGHLYRIQFHDMKNLIPAALAMTIVAGMTGCATSYMIDRRRDAIDIFTASRGSGLGGKARIGPVQAGLIFVTDATGLRGGRFYDTLAPYGMGGDLCLLIAGFEDFNCQGRAPQPRKKEFTTVYCVVPLPMDFKGGPTLNAAYWTQLEAVLAIGPSFRLGFNPGELIDFMLGWGYIDIYGDDMEAKRAREITIKAPGTTCRSPHLGATPSCASENK